MFQIDNGKRIHERGGMDKVNQIFKGEGHFDKSKPPLSLFGRAQATFINIIINFIQLVL